MTGIITTKRYKYATVFMSHFSIYSYMHIQQTNSAEENLEVENAFERMADSYIISIKK